MQPRRLNLPPLGVTKPAQVLHLLHHQHVLLHHLGAMAIELTYPGAIQIAPIQKQMFGKSLPQHLLQSVEAELTRNKVRSIGASRLS